VQSANASNSASDRAALDQEVQQRLAEIDRISSQTAYNGQKILDGNFGTATFQVGANVGETISVALSTSMRTNAVGQIAEKQSAVMTANALTGAAGALTIKVGSAAAVTVGASAAGSSPGQDTDSAYAKAQAINAAGISGLTVTASNSATAAWSTMTLAGGDGSYALKVNNTTVYSTTANGTITAANVVSQVNLYSSTTGVSAALDAAGTSVVFSTADGRNIVLDEDVTAGTGGTAGGLADGVASGAGVTTRGKLTLSASENITLGGTQEADIGFTNDEVISKDTTTLAAVNVLTVVGAETALKRLDAALTSVSALRSTFGAIQNRFESTIANLSTVVENLSASRSRILDADFAAETAALTRAQILQQAGTAILAQANTAPQNVLSLLR
jgi:flagellin